MRCPSESTLVNSLCGWLDSLTQQQIESHLRHCESCKTTFASLKIDFLRRLGQPESPTSATPISTGVAGKQPRLDKPSTANIQLREKRIANEQLSPARRPGAIGNLAGYDVIAKAGEGEFAVVYQAADWTLGRTLALKVLRKKYLNDDQVRLRFLREARAAALVNHPNVVTLYGLTHHEGLPVLAMEYIFGKTIRSHLETDKFTVREATVLGIQVASGLAKIHALGIIHRDLKPANIILGREDNRSRIIDFGLSKIVQDESTLTANGDVIGTPGYLSPEQADGSEIDYRADLFALGCVLYAMVAGVPPFRGSTDDESLRLAREITPTPLREFVPKAPKQFIQIVERLLQKKPSERYQTASDVEQALQSLLAKLPSHG